MNCIYKYVKYRNKLNGVVVAVVDPATTSNVYVGWSSCATRKGDTFDKDLGLQIAMDRAIKGSKIEMPLYIVPEYDYMVDRAKRYYKDKKIAF